SSGSAYRSTDWVRRTSPRPPGPGKPWGPWPNSCEIPRERQLWRCGAREGDVVEELGDIIQEFLVESHENLDQLDRDLVSLEEEPRNQEKLARIFRTIHTIKGTCGFFGFAKLEEVTHAGEGLLSRLRDGYLVLNPEFTSGLL